METSQMNFYVWYQFFGYLMRGAITITGTITRWTAGVSTGIPLQKKEDAIYY